MRGDARITECLADIMTTAAAAELKALTPSKAARALRVKLRQAYDFGRKDSEAITRRAVCEAAAARAELERERILHGGGAKLPVQVKVHHLAVLRTRARRLQHLGARMRDVHADGEQMDAMPRRGG